MRLDYGYAGLPSYLALRLQSVMNAAARSISGIWHHFNFCESSWVKGLWAQRSNFKLAVTALYCVYSVAPQYLTDGIRPISDEPSSACWDLCQETNLWSSRCFYQQLAILRSLLLCLTLEQFTYSRHFFKVASVIPWAWLESAPTPSEFISNEKLKLKLNTYMAPYSERVYRIWLCGNEGANVKIKQVCRISK